jgi:hypothetical protein
VGWDVDDDGVCIYIRREGVIRVAHIEIEIEIG